MTIKPINHTLKYWAKFKLTKGSKYPLYINSEVKQLAMFFNDKFEPVSLNLGNFNYNDWKIENKK